MRVSVVVEPVDGVVDEPVDGVVDEVGVVRDAMRRKLE